MKKINSNQYGGKVIGIGLLFLIIIPLLLNGITKIVHHSFLILVSYVLILIGLSILFFFAIWLGIELRQDKNQVKNYLKHKNEKLESKNGEFECQVCGNKQVKATDKSCFVCGQRFTK